MNSDSFALHFTLATLTEEAPRVIEGCRLKKSDAFGVTNEWMSGFG